MAAFAKTAMAAFRNVCFKHLLCLKECKSYVAFNFSIQ